MRLIYKVLTFFLTVGFVYLIFNYSQLIKSYPIKTISFKGEFIYADEKGIRKQLQFFIGKDLIKIDILKIKESNKIPAHLEKHLKYNFTLDKCFKYNYLTNYG